MSTLSIDQYLEKVALFVDNPHGLSIRGRFRDRRGESELAMLACPSSEELEQLRRAVAIMTATEKANADKLSDEQIAIIAADARIDPAVLAIFINGYSLYCKRVS